MYVQRMIHCMSMAARMHALMERVCRPHQLTSQQWHLMQHLRQSVNGSCTVSQLGELLCVTKGNITGILNRLEEAGLILRRMAPHDRRVVDVSLTDAGITSLDAICADLGVLGEQGNCGGDAEPQIASLQDLEQFITGMLQVQQQQSRHCGQA